MSDTPTPSQAAEMAIREALAAFPKGWHHVFNVVREREPGIVSIGALWEDSNDLARVITVDTDDYFDTVSALPIAKFIAACNPEAMTALLAQLAELRAEVERLRKNDARYRWLRQPGSTIYVDWIDFDGTAEQLDIAIDAALAADGKDGAR